MAKLNQKHYKPLLVYNEMLASSIYVSYGVSYKTLYEAARRYGGVEIPNDKGSGGMTFTCQPNGKFIIWVWTREKDFSALVHELMHAIFIALERKGIPLVKESQEVYCYYMSFILDRVLEKKKPKKRKRKKKDV